MSFRTVILTPEGSVFDGPVDALTAPGLAGGFGILPHHAPMVAALTAGTLEVRHEEEVRFYVVYGGIAEMRAGKMTILTDRLVPIEDPAEAELKLEELIVQCGPLPT
jgi:F-type H+-transporting ATPase subunit epsilon